MDDKEIEQKIGDIKERIKMYGLEFPFEEMCRYLYSLGQSRLKQRAKEIVDKFYYDEDYINQTGRAVNDTLDNLLSALNEL